MSHLNPESFMLLKILRPEIMEWITMSEISEFDAWLTHVRIHVWIHGGPYL